MARLTIDKTQFFAGEKSEDFIDDGGYSKDSTGVNPIYRKGMIFGMDTTDTEIDTSQSEAIIASCKDEDILGNDLMILDDTGQLFSIDGTTKTARGDGSTAGGSWSDGTTDLVYYKGDIFGTTSTEVVRFSGSNYSTVDDDWWTNTQSHGGLQGNYRHPMEIVEGILYIADKDDIHLWDGTNSQEDAMTLPGDCNITAMVKHPNGRYLIAFTAGTANFSGNQNSQIIAYVIDTVSLEFIQEIPLDEQVGSAIVKKGTVYVRYGYQNMKFGYFDGTGIQPIRLLPGDGNESLNGYKQTMKHWKDFIVITTDDHIYAYGEINPGQNAFWKVYSKDGDCLFADALSNDELLIQYEGTGGAEPIISRDYNQAGGDLNFKTGKITLPYKAMVTKIIVEHGEYDGTGAFGFDTYYIDTNGNRVQVGDIRYQDLGNTLRSSEMYMNVLCDSYIDLEFDLTNDDFGFSKFIIEYEPAE
jgi:hypothetical protein